MIRRNLLRQAWWDDRVTGTLGRSPTSGTCSNERLSRNTKTRLERHICRSCIAVWRMGYNCTRLPSPCVPAAAAPSFPRSHLLHLPSMSNAVDLAMSHEPEKAAMPLYEVEEKRALAGERSSSSLTEQPQAPVEFEADLEGEEPTQEDLRTLRRVSGKIPWTAFTIAFVELCERFGYYGCQVLCTSCRIDIFTYLLTSGRHKLHPARPPYHRWCFADHWQSPLFGR
jgi:hypothetical protein